MIELNQLTVGYDGQPLISQASATFGRGQLTALLGRNGTGKSTLLRTLTGLHPAKQGDVLLDGKPLFSLSVAERAKYVSYVHTGQIRIPHLKCKDVVALGRAPYTRWDGHLTENDHRMVAGALEAVGMAAYADRTMDRMSDGECQRVMIARALAQDTPVILLDEPTSFLDLPNRYELGLLLRRLAHGQNKCIVFSTHELDIALNVCDTVALIAPPRLHHASVRQTVESGWLEKLFQNDSVAFDPHAQRVVFKQVAK